MKVLDSYALMAYLEKESGYEAVRDLLSEASNTEKPCLMTTVNWGEVFYIITREQSLETAEEIAGHVATFPIRLCDVDKALAKQAAIFKATKKMSYADCFAAALAKTHKMELVTGDKEFKEVEGIIKIQWI